VIVVLATGVFDKGGISRYTRYHVRALRESEGGGVFVLSLLGPGPNDFEESFSVDYSGDGTSLSSKAAFVQAALRACTTLAPRAVWCNHVNMLPLALLARGLGTGVQVAVNVYGLELWSTRQWMHARTLPKADLVVSDCHFSADFAAQRYGLQRDAIRVIWDCVDIQRFRPEPRNGNVLRKYGVPTGSAYRYVLTLGRISRHSRHKGYDRLLDAMVALRGRPSIVALIAGDGDDRLRLERRVRSEGLEERVWFLGAIDEAHLVDVYNLADIFVLLSDRGYGRGEGVPLAVLEAAACGKAVLVGDEDGAKEAVVDGVNGRVISPRIPEQLRDTILELTSDDQTRERMGQAGRVRIEAHFSYEQFRARMAAALAQLHGPAWEGVGVRR
jgi:phosphatidylinositol alpha-1,6-mannosyltransferase